MPLRARLALACLALAACLPALAQDVRIAVPRVSVTGTAETPVEVRAARISAEIGAGVALTRVELELHNPNGRVLEGELQFPLLEGQGVVGFALDVDGRLRDAVPVEKARAQAIFEDITRARIDPGLLEVTQGNHYKVRVYPIPARGSRYVSITYAETLPVRRGQRVYRAPVAYARGVREIVFEAKLETAARPAASHRVLGELPVYRVGRGWRVSFRRAQPLEGVVEVIVPDETRAPAISGRFGDTSHFIAEGRVKAVSRPRALPASVQLVWDSSGSMAARDFARERALLDAYFAGRDVDVTLVRVRDTAEAPAAFRIRGGHWPELRQALESTTYDGGTNLAAVAVDAAAGEVLLFSDGLGNFGEATLPRSRVPLYAITSTAGAASAMLRQRAEESGGRLIDLLAESPEAARAALMRSMPRVVDLSGDNVRELVMPTPILSDGRFSVAGMTTAAAASVRVDVRHADGRIESLSMPITESKDESRLPAVTWARWRLARLEADPTLHRAEIRRLGSEYGLATRETSLLVLERVEDYVRHNVKPPPELAEAVARHGRNVVDRREADRRSHVERVVRLFAEKQAWWEREFPKDPPPPPPVPAPMPSAPPSAGAQSSPSSPPAYARPAPSVVPPAPASPAAPAASARALTAPQQTITTATTTGAPAPAQATIQLKPVQADAPYARRMREADAQRAYAIYLDERPDYVRSSGFFLDAADILTEKGASELALRVLSNLAEMELENRALLRILGYRLLQAGRPELAVAVFRQVLELAPNEPQSHRDLGLALHASGQDQKAVDALAEVVMRPWDGRFPEIELVALAELNAIVAASAKPLDTSRLDPRLLRNLSLDLRVVLTWDADNTDMDLWVTDPNGERSYYGKRLTHQGGRMSPDFRGGYGPEEFSLRDAKPGTYKVQVNFYGHRQQVVAGATTVQVKLVTGFGTPRASERIVTLRLRGAREEVTVGEFEVAPRP